VTYERIDEQGHFCDCRGHRWIIRKGKRWAVITGTVCGGAAGALAPFSELNWRGVAAVFGAIAAPPSLHCSSRDLRERSSALTLSANQKHAEMCFVGGPIADDGDESCHGFDAGMRYTQSRRTTLMSGIWWNNSPPDGIRRYPEHA